MDEPQVLPTEKTLTAKQEEFCLQYLIDLNATQAALRAGYSKETAGQIGHENLKKVEIQERLTILMDERKKRTLITQDEVINELKRVAFSDMRKVAMWNGSTVTLEDSSDLDDDTAACVESVSQTTTKEGGSISCKLHPKVKSLELLARHLGMLNDKIDHTTKGNEIKQNIYNVINEEQKKHVEDLHNTVNEI